MTMMNTPEPQMLIAPLLIIVLVMTVFPPATIDSAASDTSHGPGKKDRTTVWSWEAPKNFTGDIAVVLRLQAENETFCRWESWGVGRVDETKPVLHWQVGLKSSGRNGGAFVNAETVHAHALGTLDTWPVTVEQDGRWSAGRGSASRFGTDRWGHRLNITIAAFNLELWDGAGAEAPFGVELSCDRPVKLSKEAGRHVKGFHLQTMTDDGAGASVYAPLGGSTQLGARRTETFSGDGTELVRFQADYTGDWAAAGDLALHHPEGTRSWSLSSTPSSESDAIGFVVTHDGRPGTYHVDVDFVGARTNPPILVGVLAGLAPVEDLDELTVG